MALHLPAFLAKIPLPLLIGVPVAGLVIGVIIYEVEKSKAAPAAAAPPGTTPPAPGSVAAATYKTPAGTVVALPSALTESALLGGLRAPPKAPASSWLHRTVLGSMFSAAAPSAPTGVLLQAQQSAQQILASLPSPFPNDIIIGAPPGLNEQIVRGQLNLFIQNPTQTQLQTAVTALYQNSQGATGSPLAASAASTLNRFLQTLNA